MWDKTLSPDSPLGCTSGSTGRGTHNNIPSSDRRSTSDRRTSSNRHATSERRTTSDHRTTTTTLNDLPHVVLTSDIDWDPSIVDNEMDFEEWLDAQMEHDDLPGINDYGDLTFDDQGYYY